MANEALQTVYCRLCTDRNRETCSMFDDECTNTSLSVIQNTFLNNKIVDTININQSIYNNLYNQIKILNKHRSNWDEPNQSQYKAIIKSILCPISLIHGPPGTGKTSTCGNLINFIIQLQQNYNLES
eukprot:425976_1